jgi:hypothetical protein
LYAIVGQHEDALHEDVAYLGAPLLLIVALFTFSFWRRPIGKLLVALFGLVSIASLGPGVTVAGHYVPLPWIIFKHLPLIRLAHPARLMMFASLDVALIVALWARFATTARWARGSLVLLSIVCLLPNPAPEFWHGRFNTPSFFTSGLYRRYLPAAETVLIVPNTDTMVWQAQAGMYFRMAQTGSMGPSTPRSPLDIQREPILRTLWTGILVPDYEHQFRLFLSAHHVRTLVVLKSGGAPWNELAGSLGAPPISAADVLLYKIDASGYGPSVGLPRTGASPRERRPTPLSTGAPPPIPR